MDLNIYSERQKPFEFKKFKDQISLFMLRNQIKSSHSSSYFKDALTTLNIVVKEQILDKSEDNINQSIEMAFEEFDKFEKSELYENLQDNEKGVFSCLLGFTRQYIQATKENKYYYNDQIIKYETLLMTSNPQEMFDFSKQYFALMLKNKKLSFDSIIQKEITNFEEKYGFKDIFFRKTLNIRDKIVLLKNFKTLDVALEEISKDLEIPTEKLSLNGLISISFEPTILGYSSATAYMNKLDGHYIISLGKYDDIKTLKQSYFHEFAHCLDYSQNKTEKKMTYSEVALMQIKENPAETAIEKIMQQELGFENYHTNFQKQYEIMQQEIFNLIKEEFEIIGEIDLKEFKTKEISSLIIDNYYKLDTYKLMHVLMFQALWDKKDYIQAMKIKNMKMPEEKNSKKFKNIEAKIQLLREKYNYVLTGNSTFFLHEGKTNLLEIDKKENKQYYTKPLEIFARAFETYYRTEKAQYYSFVEKSNKENYKNLLKEAINDMLPKNETTPKRTLK